MAATLMTKDREIVSLTADEISRIPVLRDMLCDNENGGTLVPLVAVDSIDLAALLAISRDPQHAADPKIQSMERVVQAIHAADYLGMDDVLPSLYAQLQCAARELDAVELGTLLNGRR